MVSQRTSPISKYGWADGGPKRVQDMLLAIVLLCFLSPMMACIAVLIRTTSKGGAIYWSERIGQGNVVFKMPKFRTMRLGAPTVATHLFQDPGRWVTPLGRLLRRLSLDELPQLYSIFKGDMSFIGPRPALFNQTDLIALRTQKGLHRLLPGVTGWAQINGRDELPIPIKVEYDEYYKQHQSLRFDVRILGLTIIRVARRSGVTH